MLTLQRLLRKFGMCLNVLVLMLKERSGRGKTQRYDVDVVLALTTGKRKIDSLVDCFSDPKYYKKPTFCVGCKGELGNPFYVIFVAIYSDLEGKTFDWFGVPLFICSECYYDIEPMIEKLRSE